MSKSGLLPMEIEKQVGKALESYFQDSDPLFIIGVSGGVDSMSLLHVFYRLKVRALVVHVNYGKRGVESDKDAELVEQMAFEWGYDCHSVKADYDSEARDEGNFQQWARNLRYEIFRALQAEHNARGIAVGHHEDDLIETILQKIFRGAGLESWSAMQVWNKELFRPLIHVTGRQIEQYAEKNSVPFRTDRSNLRSDFARNFLRNEWLEGLENYFPGWRDNILRIPDQADLFGQALEELAEDIIIDENRIDREKFLELRRELRSALLLHLLKDTRPGLSISHDALNELSELESLQTGKSIQLASDLFIMRNRTSFDLMAGGTKESRECLIQKKAIEAGVVSVHRLAFRLDSFDNIDYAQGLHLDIGSLEWPLKLRSWEEGDRFQPLGMKGRQNVSDHLTNRKISASRKKEALVLETFDGIICAVIFPPDKKYARPGTISEQFKCGEHTQKCLIVKQE